MTQNLILSILAGLSVGLLSYPFTYRLKAESRHCVALALAAICWLVAWPILEFYRPSNYEEPRRTNPLALLFYCGVMLIYTGICSALMNRIKNRVAGVLVGILSLVSSLYFAVVLWPS